MSQIIKTIQYALSGATIKFKVNNKDIDLKEEDLDLHAAQNFDKLVSSGELKESDRQEYFDNYGLWKSKAKSGKYNIDAAGQDNFVSMTYEGEASPEELGLTKSSDTEQRSKFGKFFTNRMKQSEGSYMSRLNTLMGQTIAGLGTKKILDDEAYQKALDEQAQKAQLQADKDYVESYRIKPLQSVISEKRFGGSNFTPETWNSLSEEEKMGILGPYAVSLMENSGEYFKGKDTGWMENFKQSGIQGLDQAKDFFSHIYGDEANLLFANKKTPENKQEDVKTEGMKGIENEEIPLERRPVTKEFLEKIGLNQPVSTSLKTQESKTTVVKNTTPKPVAKESIEEMNKRISNYINKFGNNGVVTVIDKKTNSVKHFVRKPGVWNDTYTEYGPNNKVSSVNYKSNEFNKIFNGKDYDVLKTSDYLNKNKKSVKKALTGSVLDFVNKGVALATEKKKPSIVDELTNLTPRKLNPTPLKSSINQPYSQNIEKQTSINKQNKVGQQFENKGKKLKDILPNLSEEQKLNYSELLRTLAANKANLQIPTTVHVPMLEASAETPISVTGDYISKAEAANRANEIRNIVGKPQGSDQTLNLLASIQANKQASDVEAQGSMMDLQARKQASQTSLQEKARSNAERTAVANQNIQTLAGKRQAEQDIAAEINKKNVENIQTLWGTRNLEKKAKMQQQEGIQQQISLTNFQEELRRNPKYVKAFKALSLANNDIYSIPEDDYNALQEYNEFSNKGSQAVALGKDPWKALGIIKRQSGGTLSKAEATFAKDIWKERNKESKTFSSIYEKWVNKKLSSDEKEEASAAKEISSLIRKIIK